MLRRINRQQIFKDREDYEKFLSALNDVKLIGSLKLYAYCLMGNHIHLLIKEKREGLDPIFCRIDSRFMYWYNAKYDREKHLFQDRYRAESVDNEEYLLTVLRYIHQNPVKVGLCETVDLPLLQVMDTNGKEVLFRDLPEVFDLSFLGEIQLSNKRIIIKPRKNAFTKDLTPITFELPYFPDKK